MFLYITANMACTITSDKTPSLSPISKKSLYRKKKFVLNKSFFCQSLNTQFIGFVIARVMCNLFFALLNLLITVS